MSWFGSKPSPKGIIRPSVSGSLTHWSWSAAARAKESGKREIQGGPPWGESLSSGSHHQAAVALHSALPPTIFSVTSRLLVSLWGQRRPAECLCGIKAFHNNQLLILKWPYFLVNGYDRWTCQLVSEGKMAHHLHWSFSNIKVSQIVFLQTVF